MIYYKLYYQFYLISRFLKNNVPGSMFYNTGFDSIMLLSGFEFLNVASVWLILDLKSVTGNTSLDSISALTIFLIINYFLFIRRKRYLLIAKQLEKQSSNSSFSWSVITFFYVTLSIVSFFIIHSTQV